MSQGWTGQGGGGAGGVGEGGRGAGMEGRRIPGEEEVGGGRASQGYGAGKQSHETVVYLQGWVLHQTRLSYTLIL